jgi:hypothetical protein
VDALEDVRLFLPQYLSPDRQSALWEELRRFPNNRTLYTEHAQQHELLQGDGWQGLVAIDFDSGERKALRGLILSNSCDISPDNPRALAAKITFAPLLRVSRFLDKLKDAGQTDTQVTSLADSMRRQKITSMMFLPAISGVMEDSVALMGDIHSHPLEHFRTGPRTRVFRLNDFGFYLLLFKLSIHFSRMLENVER